MRNPTLSLLRSATVASLALSASAASAHIELVDPPPRYSLPANKSCPCGDGDSNRVCDVPAAESRDPNRSTNVTTLEAGSTITVRAEEYIDHAGRMRVAFDPDGADLTDFNANILVDEPDPSDSTVTQANPKIWEFQITVPNEPCENCTLQVIQAMHGDTENPVADPAPLSTYYTCADIRIVPAGTLVEGAPDAGGSTTGGGSGPSGAGGSAVATGGAGGGSSDDGDTPASGGSSMASTGGRSAGGSAGTSAAPVASGDGEGAEVASDGGDDGGCALTSAGSARSFGWAIAPLAALVGLELRRRQRRAAR